MKENHVFQKSPFPKGVQNGAGASVHVFFRMQNVYRNGKEKAPAVFSGKGGESALSENGSDWGSPGRKVHIFRKGRGAETQNAKT